MGDIFMNFAALMEVNNFDNYFGQLLRLFIKPFENLCMFSMDGDEGEAANTFLSMYINYVTFTSLLVTLMLLNLEFFTSQNWFTAEKKGQYLQTSTIIGFCFGELGIFVA